MHRRWFLLLLVVPLLAACDDDSGPDTASSTSVAVASSTSRPSSSTTAVGPPVATERGIGPLLLGMTLDDAEDTGAMGPTRPGCELAGPGELAADLTGGIKGLVYFDEEVLTGLVVYEGARTAAGIGPGSTLDQIRQAFASGHRVEVDESTVETFGVAIVSVFRGETQVFAFDVDPETDKARSLGIPSMRFCE
jgi:hypothetical protein